MKYTSSAIIFLLLISCSNNTNSSKTEEHASEHTVQSAFSDEYRVYKNGDIIFQVTESPRSRAIQLATKSQYNHVGVIFFREGIPFVLQAGKRVEDVPLLSFISIGTGGQYVVKRMKGENKLNISPEALKGIYTKYLNKPYDNYFQWSDESLYCSELVWKIYKNTFGIELCKLKTLKEFDLTTNEVKSKLAENYGSNIPLNESVVAPSDLYNSTALVEVERK